MRFDPYLGSQELADFYTQHYQEMYARVPVAVSYFDRQRGYGRRLLEAVQSWLPPAAKVLEVGCGAGGALSVFQESGRQVYGCDYSVPLVAYGRERGLFQLAIGDLIEARNGLRLESKSVDLIFLHHVFEHLISPVEWLKAAQDLLTDRGLIIVAVPDVAGIENHASPNGDLRLFLHIAHKYNFTMQGLQAAASRAGLTAACVNVSRSTNAPEFWVAFGRHDASAMAPAPAWRGTCDELLQRLRAIERRYLLRGGVRKIKRLLGNVLPIGRSS